MTIATGMIWAVGLMSGTSLDGIDAALIRTDGIVVAERGPWITLPYDAMMRDKLRELTYGRGDVTAVENELTRMHADAVKLLLTHCGMTARQIGVVGMHGQSIQHRPEQGITWQIGNGALLAELTKINVVCDFRRRDVAAGGQGAPLVPLYHAALAQGLRLPIVVLNIGGIGNVSWIGRSERSSNDLLSMDILAFDTGPGNVQLNEWALRHTGEPLDKDGALALAGAVDKDILARMLEDRYLHQHPPKSLDRNYFSLDAVAHLSPADGAATLTAFVAEAAKLGSRYFPLPANAWYVTGGGRHNPALMQALKDRLGVVEPVEVLGWEGDALEAQAFAFLAVRSLNGMVTSLPSTTGVNLAVTGGAFHRA